MVFCAGKLDFYLEYISLHLFPLKHVIQDMLKVERYFFYLVFIFSVFYSKQSEAQFTVNAGPDKIVCPGQNTLLGSVSPATGGLAPYTYSWSPPNFLSSTTAPNPICTLLSYATYTLTVTDDTGAVATDVVIVSLHYSANVNAGNDTSICEQSFALLGADLNVGGAGINYTWLPTTYLNNNTLPRPTSSPLLSTTYTLTATSAACPPVTDEVTVTIIPTPDINAGPDVTIQEGEVTILNATGGFYYAWSPPPTLTYQFSPNAEAEPIVTTTYYLYGTDDSNKCPNYDSMTVFVIPSDEVVFYNTFTPNDDGNNDTWYIGNIYKYPLNKLEIYNRNGKLVYKISPYVNNWDGKAFGETLPAGTYFYVLDLGEGKGKKNGTVTIIN